MNNAELDKQAAIDFNAFLDSLNIKYAEYLKAHKNIENNNIRFYFVTMPSTVPPSIRLRYGSRTGLDENIKNEVIDKYKELYGSSADFQTIS